MFLVGVHGDETFTLKIIKKFSGQFDWMIANEKAVNLGKRFVETDLNRCAPGFKYSRVYERRRSFQILNSTKKYDAVIDLHGTDANSGIFLIVNNPKKVNIQLAKVLPVKNVVIWESEKKSARGPVTRFVSLGLEIECGPKNSTRVQNELKKILIAIIAGGMNNIKVKKNYFCVYGKLYKNEVKGNYKFTDFKPAKLNKESFYPILVNQYKEILCYKMKKVSVSRGTFRAKG